MISWAPGSLEGRGERQTNYIYLWKDLDNLLHFLLKVCFQNPVSFINHEALPSHAGIQSKKI